MRILLSSNAPWCRTGYGVQVENLLPRVGALECVGGAEKIALFAWYGVQGGLTQWGPHVVYPGHAHPYGVDVIGHHARHFGADVVITLIDVWTQAGVGEKVAPARWLPWFPVDTEPASPRVLDALQGAALPLVYSHFGERMLKQAGVECAYVPHGIEPAVYKVLPEDDVAQFRTALFGDAPHLTLMVAANKGFDRKAFQVNLRAWAAFAKEEPGALLYIHTDSTSQAQGVDLSALAAALGIAGRVRFPDRYSYYLGYPADYMALLYNAADVLLAASMSEGFGIPIIEAQACGTPVIVTDFASMPELVRWGTAVSPADHFWLSGLESWWAWPDWRGVRDALGNVGREKQQRVPVRRKSASGAIHTQFEWEEVVHGHWEPVLRGAGHLASARRTDAAEMGARV
jgi:glycosyltransferase involved in cell wall biosynthesis